VGTDGEKGAKDQTWSSSLGSKLHAGTLLMRACVAVGRGCTAAAVVCDEPVAVDT
jgi:hypothetical protein